MAPPTAGRAISHALRMPLESDGWRSRASGWWTREVTPEWQGVLVASATFEGQAAGHGHAYMYVGVRHAGLEERLAQLIGYRATYRDRTVIKDLGGMLATHPDWFVTPDNASRIAEELATEVRLVAKPHIRSLVADDEAVLAETHWRRVLSAVDACRHVLASAELRGAGEARAAIDEILTAIMDRGDRAACEKREHLSRLRLEFT